MNKKKISGYANPERRNGSFFRRDTRGDVLYWFFRYREILITLPKRKGVPIRVRDELAEALFADQTISSKEKANYETGLCDLFSLPSRWDDVSIEAVYRAVHDLRRDHFSPRILEEYFTRTSLSPAKPSYRVPDERRFLKERIKTAKEISFALCDPALTGQFLKDLSLAEDNRKSVTILVSMQSGDPLPTKERLEKICPGFSCSVRESDPTDFILPGGDERTDQPINGESHLLLCYGEEGLFLCRNLLCDAFVQAIPKGFAAQAVSGQWEEKAVCAFVPKGFDITSWVPFTARTRVTYRLISQVLHRFGEKFLSRSVEEWYDAAPELFFDVYGFSSPEEEASIPFSLPKADGEGDFFQRYEIRCAQGVSDYLRRFKQLEYFDAYFTPEMKREAPLPEPKTPQDGILVQAARIRRARDASVIPCEKGTLLRRYLSEHPEPEAALVSNFLFFLTPKLAALYNSLRQDRPREQADASAGHLDYKLSYENGKRIETFPLFHKMCIAKKKDGSFLFFRFRLGSGEIRLGDQILSWNKSDVDPTEKPGEIAVYTPYSTLPDREADRESFRKAVGQGRVNLVFLGERLVAIRHGDVLLPGVGVVISLCEDLGLPLLSRLPSPRWEDGYFDPSQVDFSVTLAPPERISHTEWNQVSWAFGGGMTLMEDGIGLCDGDHTEAWLTREGWFSPLSRQTQESALHQLVKHPRTAIGTNGKGDLLLLVFSGRTLRSSGADYREMCHVARKLFPDITTLMNVDGGGSSVLGLAIGSTFRELSFPSTSTGSCAGMIRPVNTVFRVPLNLSADYK